MTGVRYLVHNGYALFYMDSKIILVWPKWLSTRQKFAFWPTSKTFWASTKKLGEKSFDWTKINFEIYKKKVCTQCQDYEKTLGSNQFSPIITGSYHIAVDSFDKYDNY